VTCRKKRTGKSGTSFPKVKRVDKYAATTDCDVTGVLRRQHGFKNQGRQPGRNKKTKQRKKTARNHLGAGRIGGTDLDEKFPQVTEPSYRECPYKGESDDRRELPGGSVTYEGRNGVHRTEGFNQRQKKRTQNSNQKFGGQEEADHVLTGRS